MRLHRGIMQCVTFVFLFSVNLLPLVGHAQSDTGGMIGGGNFDNATVDANALAQLEELQTLGARNCRVNLYPSNYLQNNDWNHPNVTVMDALMKAAHMHNVTPMILFEWYADYPEKIHVPLGSEAQWAALGRAFAERYRPGGVWAKENGIKNWGVTVYTAFNEPDNTDFVKGGKIGPAPYISALKGLASGVHSVSPRLHILPGGFMSPNAFSDFTLRGLGPALAPLFNEGELDGIDLHTYYDVQYAPMKDTYDHSAQHNFDMVKEKCGITRDINFYSSEFNFKRRLVTEDQAASGMLTGIFDNLGVVKNDGKTPATQFAMPWNLFHSPRDDPEYGLREAFIPLTLTTRGKTLKKVLDLTRGMHFVKLDPRRNGEFVMEGAVNKLWVWQDRRGWTDHVGNSYIVKGIPAGTLTIEVYGWDGLRKTIPTQGLDQLQINDLPGDETYLFLSRPRLSDVPSH